MRRATILLVTAGVLVMAARPARAQTVLPRAGWVATGSPTGGGSSATSAIDGSASTRWTTATSQTSGQWFSLDMITPQAISQVTLDPGSSAGDFPRAFQVFVSNDAVTWGDPVASGSGAAGVVTIAFPTQTARFVGIVQTASGASAWSVAEINVYGPGAVPQVALSPSGWGASASATGGSDVASRALDGLTSTRWSSGVPQASGQSFQLDLRTSQAITKLQLDAGPSTSDYPRAFQIFATNDTANWGAAIATGTGAAPIVQVSFPQRSARYVKVVLTANASSWWSVAELTVFGVGDFSPVATALPRLGWTATASAVCAGDVPARALDDDINTRFSTGVNQANGQTFTLDMKVKQSFTKLTLDAAGSSGDYPRGYQVFVSNDGVTWGSSVATGAGTSALVTITFPSQTARYVKIVQTGTSPSAWWSIAELNVYGVPPVELLRSGWLASASAGASPGSGIDGNLSTRWATNAPQVNGQWFQIDMRAAQTFDQIILDTTGFAGDYPRGYQVFVSNSPTSFGAAVATGVATSPVVSIGFPTQTGRYLRVVQTGSTSNWWSIAELNVLASPALVQIADYVAAAYYATSDIASSFVSAQGDAIDCIPFEAQASVRAWRAAGVALPTTWPVAPSAAAGTPATNVGPNVGFDGQPDANGHARGCGAGLVPTMRPTVQAIQAAGGVTGYRAKLAARPHPMGMQHPVQHDCWLNDQPGDGVTLQDWEHASVLQTKNFEPAGAPGYFGARATFSIYNPYLQGAGEHSNVQWWIQSGTCNSWWDSSTCRTGSACTTCTGAACDGCAVQSLEVTPIKTGTDDKPKLGVFITTDGYFKNFCFSDTEGCSQCPVDALGHHTGCFVATPMAPFAPGMTFDAKPNPGASPPSPYGRNFKPAEVTLEAFNGAQKGNPGWFVFVNGSVIGMYPPGSFNWPDGTPGALSTGPATYLQAGAEVYDEWPEGLFSDRNHTNTVMWSDNRADEGFGFAGYVRNLQYFDAQGFLHPAVLETVTVPAAEGDLGIPGVCGLHSGGWADPFSGIHGGYTGSLDAPPGEDGWGSYYYFGGGLSNRDVGPGTVTINVHQSHVCDKVHTAQGDIPSGANKAYVVVDVDDISNTSARAESFAFDPNQLTLVEAGGATDQVDMTLPLTSNIFGPFAMTAGTVTPGSDQNFTIPYHMGAIVHTQGADGAAEAAVTRYEIRYKRKMGDPPVTILNSTSTPLSLAVNRDCRETGLVTW